MTLEEKAQQVVGILPMGLTGEHLIESSAERVLSLGVGHIGMFSFYGHKSPERTARLVNEIQNYLVNRTRLGIPALFHIEALNGLLSPDFTVFPTAIALAATWNPTAVEEMAAILGRQARSIGHPFVMSPVMDVARDARWGRVHETYGEDPYLASAMSVAFTRGMQGDDLREGAIVTGKHFLGYAQTLGGQNMAATAVTDRELYEVHARPFEAAIKVAGLAGIMNSYSSVDGIPVVANRKILTELLRERLGFTGTVVSDYDSVRHLESRLRVAADAREAGRLALAAGLDVELPMPYGYGDTLVEAVRDGVVPEEQLDAAVLRVLRDKFALGLFDQPFVNEDPIVLNAIAKQGTDLSELLAQQSITLLTNDGVLPLSRAIRRIAVVGPHADNGSVAFPAYTFPAGMQMLLARMLGQGVDIPGTENLMADLPPEALEAVRSEFGGPMSKPVNDYIRESYGALSLADAIRALVPDVEVISVAGCGVLDSDPADIDTAVAAALEADVVVLAIGGRPGWFVLGTTEGEGCDTADIALPSIQAELVRAVAATGTPCVGVLQTGRPMALGGIVEHFGALVHGYLGGQAGTKALASALFGDVNPSGKLPVTMPRHVGQVPIYYGQHTGSGYQRTDMDMHHGYSDMSSTPLFPFGHGLSYTRFEYSDLSVTPDAVQTGGAVTVSLTIRNTGPRSGTEVAQLYVHDLATGVTRPAMELVGFERVELESGAAARVEFTVAMSQLGYVGFGGTFVLEPGPIEVFIGSSSDDIRLTGAFEAVGPTVQLEGRRTYLSKANVTHLS
jgi:beta-glucosidase